MGAQKPARRTWLPLDCLFGNLAIQAQYPFFQEISVIRDVTRAWLFRKWLKMVIIHLSAFATFPVLHSESMPSKPTQTSKEE
jgi:hypothetical protein